MLRAYFDHNATTPLAPEVVDSMLPVMTGVYGNASSVHSIGQAARKHLDEARRDVARLLGAAPEEIVFTSGATEADNLAISGLAQDGHVIATAVEHPAVLMAARALGPVTVLPVNADCMVDPAEVQRALRPDTRLIAVMHVNNETGVIQPVEEIARIAAGAGIPMHCDGVQAFGRIPIDVKELGVSSYAISAHKLYGPKGVGALVVRKGAALAPAMFGGPQERGRRAGTENIAGIVGMACAMKLAAESRESEMARIRELRDMLERSILERIPDTAVNGAGADRVANTTNIRFDGIDSDALLIALDLRGYAVSSGAACSSGATEPSHVLLAMGLTKEQARSSIRFSLGRSNTAEQVHGLLDAVADAVAHLRKLSPVYV